VTTDQAAPRADPATPPVAPRRPEPAPTYDIDAERVVLGAMLLDRTAVEDLAEILTAADFYRPIHGTIYTAILNRYGAGEPTDPVAVAAHLLATGDLQRIGGAPYLQELLAVVPTAASGTWYARTIADHAGRRRLTTAAVTISQAATTPSLSLADAQDRAGAALHAAITVEADTAPSRAADLVTDAFNAIDEAAEHKGLRGIHTGLTDLDMLTGGWQAGQLIVIAGRPGMGKSVAALDCARLNAIKYKIPTLFSTLEMSKPEVMQRILSAEASVPHHAIVHGEVNDDDWTRLGHKAADLADAPLFIDDANVNLIQLRTRARRIKERHGLGLLVVDYLQLMPAIVGNGRDRGREREVAELSRGLKLLAKELMCPVIAVSQLNRGPDGRNDKRPGLHDLRESGAVENDADVVILIYREDYYDKECPRAGEADFIVAKNRHGATDTVTCVAQLRCMRFVDLANVEDRL
jgi:replicative DNA helicase